MKDNFRDAAHALLALAEHSLRRHHQPRVEACLKQLTERQIWWRPNAASNSAGNLALHLAGNVRQWLVAGLGGARDLRRRDREFSERGPVARALLQRTLRGAVRDACRVLRGLSAEDLARPYTIQGLRVSGFQAVHHVVEHFAFHTGQIVFLTKQQRGRDLGFTRLPGERRARKAGAWLPVL